MDGRDGMRAADADREAVAERLRAALNEGRLDLHEYDERLQRAYAARTYAELDPLLSDLPPMSPAAQPAPQSPGPVAQPSSGRLASFAIGDTNRWLGEVWFPYLKVLAIVVTIWGVTSLLSQDLLYFWPVWVAGPWGVVLVLRTVGGLAAGEPRRQAIERERRRQRKRAKRERRRQLRSTEPDKTPPPT
ncbi:DUF1707 domain-containing protein [Micromonospora sp. NPDC049801]|uniref:DUF1707 SHOCT-like domain-containing protein n=1 Tax=unclassified Micromonospora TaxID=2617518 RepID=UPI0033C926D2